MKLSCAVVLSIGFCVSATTYGRSKIQTGGGEWWMVSSPQIELYYPIGSEALAESVLSISETELGELSTEFGYLPDDPVPVVVYPSPGTFRQTDIIDTEIDEAVGGFTEYFKGRVVVPFTGSWSEFRHVLTHELNHAYIFDMLYRRSLQSVIMSTTPLWTMEGLAEYTSAGWDPASEAEFRDLVITEQIVPLEELSRRGDYLVYRQGQAVYHFMVERYGRERFRDFVHNMSARGGLPDAIEEAFDMDLGQFDDRFQEWARETYWSELATRENPSDLGRALEDDGHGICQAVTVISPDGDRIAGIESYRGGYSVVIRSAVSGELIRRCISTGGVQDTGISPVYRVCSFSPDGESLAVAVHGVSTDRLLVSTPDGITDLQIEMELIRDPVWSPSGGAIAFCGMNGSSTDIYIWEGGTPRLVHGSPGGERDLSWSASGIYAASENTAEGTWEILRTDPSGEFTEVVLRDTSEMRYPFDSPSGLVFLRNEGGTPDLFVHDPNGATRRLTELYLTMESPSWADSGRVLAFDSGTWAGCGVYVAYGVLERDLSPDAEPTLTVPASSNADRVMTAAISTDPGSGVAPGGPADSAGAADGRTVQQPLRIAPYTPALSTDYVSALAGYDSYSGFEGYTTFVFSDVLAHHQIVLNANFNGPVNDADAAVYYTYMPMRTDLGSYLFRETTQYLFRFPDDHLEQVRDVDAGGGAAARYPFTAALGAQGGVDFRHITREGVWNSDADYSADVLSLYGRIVLDTALWDWVGPRLGERLSVSAEIAPGLGDMVEYTTISADLRKYIWISSQTSLALRLAGASSWGAEAQRFMVGGAVPHRVMTGEAEELDDLLGFYTNYGDMLRGLGYTELAGRNYVSSTAEVRIPFIRALALDAPLPLVFTNIRGVLFVDAGTAFDEPSTFVGAHAGEGYRFEDIAMGIGFGFRANLGIFLLREDTAWATDIDGIAKKPIHYISLGASF